MRLAARVLDLDDLVEDRAVVARQEGPTVDDHVDLVGAGRDRGADLGQLDVEERLAATGSAVATLATLTVEPREGLLRVGDEGRVEADRRDRRDRWVARLRDASPSGTGARILPGVSFPSSVVRSIIRIARSRAHSFEARLIDALAEPVDALLDADLVDRRQPTEDRAEGPGRPPAQARTSSLARSRLRVSWRWAVVMGR